MNKKYDIAAYIWPAYTGDEPRTRIFWQEGIGEWQTVKNSQKKDNGYFWNRKPAWGYVNEADPYVMSMQIDAAADHGVNVFIYDWYWYENAPFLEQCLNNGYLRAANNDRVKFYLMWANHDVNYTWDIRNSDKNSAVIWNGKVDERQWKVICRRWIDKYFTQPSYYKIDNKPVISIYDLNNFISSFDSVESACQGVEWLKNEAVKAGLGGVHLQFIKCWGDEPMNLSGVDTNASVIPTSVVKDLGCDSITHYQFVHFTNVNRKYENIIPDVISEYEKMSDFGITYFPHVSIGWDNNPRFKKFCPNITSENPPEQFEKMLHHAKAYVDRYNDVPLITVNSWNEWTESSYLEPDDVYGYGYLKAVKRVFCDR